MSTLDYLTPKSQPVSPKPAWAMASVALACWLLPLACGLLALLGYAVSGAEFFMLSGLVAISGGTVLALAGLILAVVTHRLSARVEPTVRDRIRRRSSLALVGLFINFPIAFVCIVVGLSLPAQVAVSVTNAGPLELTDVRLDLLGRQESIGNLAPGQRWHDRIRSGGRGRVAVSWSVDGARHDYVWAEDGDGDTVWGGVSFKIMGDKATWD